MPSTLTSVKTNNILLEDILNVKNDIVISGEFSFFGSDINGGEGFCIYVVNRNSNNNVGSPGPGLGFAPTVGKIEYLGNDVFTGTDDSILGIGFDAVGDFGSTLSPDISGNLPVPNSITLRHGSTKKYNLISTLTLPNTFSLYDVYGYKYPNQTPTQTKTPTSTNNVTRTQSIGITSTATPTFTKTRSRTLTQTHTQTFTATPEVSPTTTLSVGTTSTPTPTRSKTPTNTKTTSRTSTNTPTVTGLYPPRKFFKIRITNYGRRVLVFLKNEALGQFVKVFDQDNLNLDLPYTGQVKVGLSYSTGVYESAFYLYNFNVNGVGYTNPNTPTPTATKGLTKTQTPTQTITSTRTSTPTSQASPTQTPTNSRSPSPTATHTPSSYGTPTTTRTLTPTHTRTRYQTPTKTPFSTRTQTPTRSTYRTPTPTHSPYNTPTPTLTRTRTPYATPTYGGRLPFVAENNSTYKFVFESKWTNASNAADAVNVMINNARIAFNPNESVHNLLNLRTENNFGVQNDFYKSSAVAYFYNGDVMAAQNPNAVANDGQRAWMYIPFAENYQDTNSDIYDPRKGISSNVYQALKILTTTGNSLSSTLIYIENEDTDNYKIWGVDGLNSNYTTSTFDRNLSDRYVFNYARTADILYNTDYIEGTVQKNDFINTPDNYRIIPNTRYIRVDTYNEIDITFSYASELIYYRKTTKTPSFWGARLTLFTRAIQ
jgi:hypothetical protein